MAESKNLPAELRGLILTNNRPQAGQHTALFPRSVLQLITVPSHYEFLLIIEEASGRDDRKLLIQAAAQAQRATDYTLKRACHE